MMKLVFLAIIIVVWIQLAQAEGKIMKKKIVSNFKSFKNQKKEGQEFFGFNVIKILSLIKFIYICQPTPLEELFQEVGEVRSELARLATEGADINANEPNVVVAPIHERSLMDTHISVNRLLKKALHDFDQKFYIEKSVY